MIAFFMLLFVIMVIYFFTAPMARQEETHRENMLDREAKKAHEGFKDTVTTSAPVQPKGADPIGTLPVAPYQQVAKNSPLPYQDTTLLKANRQQVVTLLELVKGFLAFEAQEISERSDPTIQLPLQTTRGDMQTLQAEVDVMNRNPGIPSTLTLAQLSEMGNNLAYLQRQVRLTGAAGPLQGPIDEFNKGVQDTVAAMAAGTSEGFVDQASATTIKGPRATVKDLTDLIARIQGEITRLSASATTDPIVQARITALTKMKGDVQDLVTKVNAGALKESDLPIMKADIDHALPILGKPTEPLPQLLKATGLPAGLANLLPSSLSKDPETMREITRLMNTYGDTIANGVSATFQVSYTPPRLRKESTIDQTGFPSMDDLDNVSNIKFMPSAPRNGQVVTDHLAAKPMDAGRGPAHFDWKERANAIEDQVIRRGLKPTDFGIMPPNTKVSKDFSWKGYAKMICTRLQATMDPGLPETCGCPPMDWKGWRMNDGK